MKSKLQFGEGASFANSRQGAAQDRDRGEGVSTQNDSPKSRPWLIAVPTAVLVLLGVIWSGFWYWSTTAAEATMTAWRSREAEAGRIYGCAATNFGGYPFRIEVACAEPSVDDRATALSIRARNLAAVAQVWDPTLVIGEIEGPMTVSPLGGSPTATIDWTLAQASLRGVPGAPERLSIVVDKPSLASVPPAGALASAEHMEFHGRFAAESTPGHPVLDLGFDVRNAMAPALVAALGTFGPLASASTDLSIVAVLRGASDLAPKPLGQRLRQIQAANGRLDITNARLQQGDLIATATGALGLTARGTLTGDLRLTVVNFTKLIPLLGIDRAVAQAVPQDTLNRFAPTLDRLMPGLGNVLRGGNGADGAKANATAALGTAVLGGQQTELEGQRAITLSLRFDDGMAFLGPLKLGQIPSLY
jgi:hypothetical protein